MQHNPLFYTQHDCGTVVSARSNCKVISIDRYVVCNALLCQQRLDCLESVAQDGGAFIIQAFRRALHLFLRQTRDLVYLPAEKAADFGDDRLVILLADPAGADAATLLYSVVQAGSTPGAGLGVLAGWKLICTACGLDNGVCIIGTVKRTEVLRAVLFNLSCERYGWEGIAGQFDIGIALIVFKKNIILGFVFLNQIVFQQQRFQLGFGDNDFKVINIGNQIPRLVIVLFNGAEVTVDTAFQIFCLAYIYDFSVFVFHEIDAGLLSEH